MARIRIVDEWRRSPISPPTRYRSILVVAETWAEQRVLMRAFAGSADQTRPTISLHGEELAIGPAGVDPHGPWGIHVEPPADGRAQDLRGQLELAARRLAGSKGNPPRLEDEVPEFERKATNQWAPGTPPDLPGGARRSASYEPAVAASQAGMSIPATSQAGMSMPAASQAGMSAVAQVMPAAALGSAPSPQVGPGARTMMAPTSTRARRKTAHPNRRTGKVGSETVGVFSNGPTAPRAPIARRPVTLAKLVGKTMPLGFRLSDAERRVLNSLGRGPLRASEVAEITGEVDGAAFMQGLMDKLAVHRLELVVMGQSTGGEATYSLKRV